MWISCCGIRILSGVTVVLPTAREFPGALGTKAIFTVFELKLRADYTCAEKIAVKKPLYQINMNKEYEECIRKTISAVIKGGLTGTAADIAKHEIKVKNTSKK